MGGGGGIGDIFQPIIMISLLPMLLSGLGNATGATTFDTTILTSILPIIVISKMFKSF